jgi:rSAM/selenodomain-associated transferase 1
MVSPFRPQSYLFVALADRCPAKPHRPDLRMKDTVVVFARAPRLGTVKHRLARDIGDRAALRFHRETLIRLLRGLIRDRRFRTVLALTPDGARDRLPMAVARRVQGRGDVGQRMDAACRRHRNGNVAIIGSDIPEANAADLRAAFRALGRHDAVFGPAEDGGFWLVALGPRRPAWPFANARWSTADALADTLKNFHNRRIGRVRTLRDVDTARDLPPRSSGRYGLPGGQASATIPASKILRAKSRWQAPACKTGPAKPGGRRRT